MVICYAPPRRSWHYILVPPREMIHVRSGSWKSNWCCRSPPILMQHCRRPIILRTVQEYFLARPTRSDAIRVIRPDRWVRSEVLSPTPHRDMRWQSHRIITTPLPGCRTAFLCRCLVLDRPNMSELMVISMNLFSKMRLGCFHSRFSWGLIKILFGVLYKPLFPTFKK